MLDKKLCREHAAPGVPMPLENGLLHAAQVDYIVQVDTRSVGGQDALVLYIHERRAAVQGDLRPLWVMFHVQDDYITLARRPDGGTFWRTASFDNLGKNYGFVDDCAFYSCQDRDRLKAFFPDDRSEGFGPLIHAQAALKARRLQERLRERQRKIDGRLSCVPALPPDWKVWVRRAVIPAYFFYDYCKSNRPVSGVCSSCGQAVTVSKARNGEFTQVVHRIGLTLDASSALAQETIRLIAAPLTVRADPAPRAALDLREPLAKRIEAVNKTFVRIPCAALPLDEYFADIGEPVNASFWYGVFCRKLVEQHGDMPTVAQFTVLAVEKGGSDMVRILRRMLVDPFVRTEEKGNT